MPPATTDASEGPPPEARRRERTTRARRSPALLLGVGLLALLVFRAFLAAGAAAGPYHGWNEGHYALIARNYFHNPWWHQVAQAGGTVPTFFVPPLYGLVVHLAFRALGEALLHARLVSLAATGVGALFLYGLLDRAFPRPYPVLGAFLYAALPYPLLWAGRNQTDALLTALSLGALFFAVAWAEDGRPRHLALSAGCFGLALLTKQAALLVPAALLLWLPGQGLGRRSARLALAYGLGAVPVLLWLGVHYVGTGDPVLQQAFLFPLEGRTPWFANAYRVLTEALLAGATPLVLLLAALGARATVRVRGPGRLLALFALLTVLFAVARSPPFHQYYALPALPALAYLATGGLASLSRSLRLRSLWLARRRALPPVALATVVLLASVPVSASLLVAAGDVGYANTRRVADFVAADAAARGLEELTVLSDTHHWKQLTWYLDLTAPGLSPRVSLPYEGGAAEALQALEHGAVAAADPASVYLVVSEEVADPRVLPVFQVDHHQTLPWGVGFQETLWVYRLADGEAGAPNP